MKALLVAFLLTLLPTISNAEPAANFPDPEGPPQRRLKVLTGSADLRAIDFADPSAPDFSDPQVVKIYTTGGEVLIWRETAQESAQNRFLRGDLPEHETLKFFYADGKTEFDPIHYGEDAWDPSLEIGASGETILYAGVMTPTTAAHARWPEDHWNRRTHAFRRDGDKWIMQAAPLFGNLPSRPTWINHNYGHQFLDFARDRWIYYERVTLEKNSQPWLTEIFARRMRDDWHAEDPEWPILQIPKLPWPAAQRESGGALIEGPRPFQIGRYLFISFSAGDYTSPDYGIHLMWAESPTGPFTPYLADASDRLDLKDFGGDVEEELPLIWGAGRAVFFQIDQRWWTIFHGLDPEKNDDSGDGKRSLYLAPVSVIEKSQGPPEIRIRTSE